MTMPRLATMLLLSTALAAPSLAFAQETPPVIAETPTPEAAPTEAALPEAAPVEEQAPEVSMPGQIVVTGQRDRNVARASDQVVSVLGTADIQRTGEGNIAGALGRVTGLSVVGSGFVYVRGLGDRYSLALLNGSPLPSPEPLRRVVPLDIFPTNVIASSLVQKSYSANFPGEFGGGVINLTTTAVPKDPFFTISAGISADSETTGKFGYSYYGAASDWTGFDDGSRNAPPALKAFFASGQRIGDGTVDTQALGGELVRFSRATLQKVNDLPVNYSFSLTGGKSFEIGDDMTLGLIMTAGFNNKWMNREVSQQRASTADLSQIDRSFTRVVTDNRIVVNGLLGVGLEFGSHKLRWTNLYVRDTIKEGRLASGTDLNSGYSQLAQDTAWFERQLIDSHFVGELRFGTLNVDLRGGYANTKREAPYETSFTYVRTNRETDPTGAYYVNRLDGQRGDASVAFSNLNEDLWSGGIDVSKLLTDRLTLTTGYAYTDTKRTSSRREFQFRAPSDLQQGVDLLRPDLLLSPGIIQYYGIDLIETTEADAAFAAALRVQAGYLKANYEPIDGVSLDLGVRFESGRQSVTPIEVFATPTVATGSTLLKKDYWLPAATVTWEVAPQMQLRVNASQTIARPQFRELLVQSYYDPESNRSYRGNSLLTDSKLFNAEARYEWYFARDQRLSLSGFYKQIDKPIETYVSFTDNDTVTSFANAPKAELYGAELDVQKYFDLSDWGGLFASRRFVSIANYTWTKSKLKVGANDTVAIDGTAIQAASNYFRSGSALTGQSDHIANLQLGLEDTDKLSQQTVLLSYASKRVISRTAGGQPDVIENPGLRVDIVLRQGFELLGKTLEMKAEARNITGRRHEEYQKSGTNRIEINTYDQPRIFSLTATMKF